MSKSIFELLTLIEAYQKYSQLASILTQEEHKKYFQSAKVVTLKLIEKFCKQKKIIIEDLQYFYENATKYLDTKNQFSSSLQKILNPISEIDRTIQDLQEQDLLFGGDLSGLKIENTDLSSLLFCKIMGRKALQEKKEMEENLEMNILSTLKENGEYYFEAVHNEWINVLNEKMKNKNLTEEQYKNYLRNIEYISNYYWMLHKKQNRMLTLNLKIGI